MTLPPVTIPDIPLPFEIPLMIHPALVHFVIVLPAVIILLEIINMFTQRRMPGLLSFFLLLATSVLLLATYLSGSVDAQHAKDLLSPAAKEMLASHKQLGTYLVYISVAVVFFKLISVVAKNAVTKFVYLAVLVLFVVAIYNQAGKGATLVYQYGVNVQSVPAAVPEKSTQKVKDANATEAVDSNSSRAPKGENNTTKK